MADGKAHVLNNKFAYNEDSILIHGPSACSVFLISEESPTTKYIEIRFNSARCARSASTDCTPAIGIYPESNEPVSFVAELTSSKWIPEAHKSYTYGGTAPWEEYKHYVISNHDVFHEIIAESFEEYAVLENNPIFPYLSQILKGY